MLQRIEKKNDTEKKNENENDKTSESKNNIDGQVDSKFEEDSLDLILNPHVYAIEDTLKAIYNNTDPDIKNDLVDELTVIFTKDDILYNRKIQAKFPELLNLLKDTDIYNHACVLLSDMVRHKPFMQDTFFNMKIFDMLDFEKYSSTMSLVFSLCYGNKKLTEIYFREIYDLSRDEKNELAIILKEQDL